LRLRQRRAVGVVVHVDAGTQALAKLVAERHALERDVDARDHHPARELDLRRNAEPDRVDRAASLDDLARGGLELVDQGAGAAQVRRTFRDLDRACAHHPPRGDLRAPDVYAYDGRLGGVAHALTLPPSRA